MNRTKEQWANCVAIDMSKMSEAAIMFAFIDAKKDISELHATIERQEQEIAALKAATCKDGLQVHPLSAGKFATPFPARDQSKPAEQQGVFRKFYVSRVDGSSEPGGKHYGCRYFVLDIDHDALAKPALQAYAAACAESHPDLSADMVRQFFLQPVAECVQPVSDSLISRDNFYSDATEDIAHALAQELEDAELSPNDYVTVNREKLSAIARRVMAKAYAAIASQPAIQAQEECSMCSGHGLIGGLMPGDGGYHSEDCPDCAGAGKIAAAPVAKQDAVDAARYRFVKENIEPDFDLPTYFVLDPENPQKWDEQIDAARATKEAS